MAVSAGCRSCATRTCRAANGRSTASSAPSASGPAAARTNPTTWGPRPTTSTNPPGYINHDITFFKNFAIGSRSLQFRAELYNAFNSAQDQDVDTSAVFDYANGANTDTNFGHITGVRPNTNRMIQLGTQIPVLSHRTRPITQQGRPSGRSSPLTSRPSAVHRQSPRGGGFLPSRRPVVFGERRLCSSYLRRLSGIQSQIDATKSFIATLLACQRRIVARRAVRVAADRQSTTGAATGGRTARTFTPEEIAAMAATMPEGPARELTVKVCGQCHEPQRAASLRLTREGWEEVIEKMVGLGAPRDRRRSSRR